MSVGPLFGGSWADAASPGFGIAAGDVSDMQRRLVGCPITLNHSGLQPALDALSARGEVVTAQSVRAHLDGNRSAGARPIGRVVGVGDGTNVTFTLLDSFVGVQEMIRAGVFNGLSLTHVANSTGEKEPLELSLTNDPARKGASVVVEYKPTALNPLDTSQIAMSATEMNVAEETPAPEPVEKTPLEGVLETLSPEQQQVVLNRLQEYETKHTELSTAAESATAEAEKAKAAAARAVEERTADRDVVKSQIENLRTLLTQQGCSAEAERLQSVPSYLDEASLGHSNLALEQVVQACSRALAGMGGQAVRPTKRRTVEAASAPAAAAAAPATPRREISSTSTVRNLLRSNFDAPMNEF